ncbi:VOC family protein [Chitinophaga sp. RAB17]|uniref:VOC family protein n=1 Tax=Chitinophaga sp. RAB17 TaxID=3233049 RepID=UPI003F914F72
MAHPHTLRGIATISLFAADHESAKKWYSELLGIAPYFELPGYAEFRIGDYEHELGLIDSSYAPKGATLGGPGGAIVYWHVEDVAGTLAKLLSMGATELEGVTERGHDFVTASVVDPFGNILGVMFNPHYLDILAARTKAQAEK